MHAERTTTPGCTMSAQPLHSRLTSWDGRAGANRRLPCGKAPGAPGISEEIAIRKGRLPCEVVPAGTWYLRRDCYPKGRLSCEVVPQAPGISMKKLPCEKCQRHEGKAPPTNHVDGRAQGAMHGARKAPKLCEDSKAASARLRSVVLLLWLLS